jgi:hypothetical protein
MSYQVKELVLPDGASPYAEWFETLDPIAAAKVSVAAARMWWQQEVSAEGYRPSAGLMGRLQAA